MVARGGPAAKAASESNRDELDAIESPILN
jgi:hypothetical protein